jgi:ABC-type xylose transport system permease subunit
MSAPVDEIATQDGAGRPEPAEGTAALAAYTRGYLARVRGGELGSIPAMVGLIVITVVFAVVHQGFLSAYNLETLVIQAAPVIIMAMGLVFVLLLGEIDLSAGTTGGLCSAIMAGTRYGRHVYAVGGNDEAARRAGVPVSIIRISVFVIGSAMAAISGLVAASLLQSVQSNAGAGNTLLLAVGAAVIGGTSLFGGRGRVIDAVLGGLVVAVIINGMSDLIQGANSAGYEWVVTGAVLLLAAGFDAVVRRRSRAS